MSSTDRQREDEESATSFAQQYDPRAKTPERLFIYCRLCRRVFPVTFRPRPQARLRCLCGHESSLAELDVFRDEAAAREFAGLYEKIYRAAKRALADARIRVPPSGKLPQIRDGAPEPSDIVLRDGHPEDMSDIASSYVELEENEGSGAAAERERELQRDALEAEDELARHAALSDLIEFLYVRRYKSEGARDRMVAACREDIEIAPRVVALAKERRRTGREARISFTSFKHLSIVLEEDGDLDAALEVVNAARRLGLKGYDERASRLRARRTTLASEVAGRHDEHAPDVDERDVASQVRSDDRIPHGIKSEEVAGEDEPPIRKSGKRGHKR